MRRREPEPDLPRQSPLIALWIAAVRRHGIVQPDVTERTSDGMYDPGLAARLDDIMAGMLEMEVTNMFGGYEFLMNGICAPASGTTCLSSASHRRKAISSEPLSSRWI